mgnify:CR=1 FL=1
MPKELIVNEVIVVGKIRPGQEAIVLPKDADKTSKEFKEAIRAKFQFVRNTNLNPEAITAGFQNGEFIHTLVADPGGEKITLASGQTVKRSRKTDDYGWKVIFKSASGITFDEIKDEIVANRFEIVGTGDEGKIRLNEYGLMGLWDKFDMGFVYTPHYRDPKDGHVKPLLSHPRDKNGVYNKEGVLSNKSTGEHFVLESELDNIEALRETMRRNNLEYKVTVKTNDDPSRTGVKEVVTPTPKADINTSV